MHAAAEGEGAIGPGEASRRFPPGFLWGAATSAHQIEGGNVNNDWWAFEHDPGSGCAGSSGDACDSFHRSPEDLDLVAALDLGAYRFSLEWSRIEPAEGEFSRAALDHYRRVCAGCRERGLVPVVTFHHFTSPAWFASDGGWEGNRAVDRFLRYVERTGAALGDLVGWACTLNEPNVVAVLGYMEGRYPPGVEDLDRYLAVNRTLAEAHGRSVAVVRAGPGEFPVGLTLSMDDMVAEPGGEGFRDAAVEVLEGTFEQQMAGDDFVGVQAYSRLRFGPEGQLPPEEGVALTQIGTENWPGAVEASVRRAATRTGLPVLVTESGIATTDDAERIQYLSAALGGLRRCLADGVDVRGFFVWSLLDNYEWDLGFGPTFGLYSVDPETFERRRRPSADWYAAVARANAVPGPA